MGKYNFSNLTSHSSEPFEAIANEAAEANRIALLAIKLEVEKQKSSVLDKENKRNVDLFIYKKNLEDQA